MKNGRCVNILLVEDNAADVRLAEEAFKAGPLSVNLEVVMDGDAALDFLKKRSPYEGVFTPDLVLLDLNLPKKNGWEVLSEIKGDQRLRSVPIIVLSNSVAENDVVSTYDLHVNCYVNKPVDFDKFFRVIELIEEFWVSTAILPTRTAMEYLS